MDLLNASIDIILKNQADNGSFLASPTFPTYRYSWIRDGSFIACAMDFAGQYESAERFFSWVDGVIRKYEPKLQNLHAALESGSKIDKSCLLNARFMLSGSEEKSDEWGNFQLDAYGTWLWALVHHIETTGHSQLLETYAKSIALTVQYLCDLWYYPNYDIWEENSDKIHTATLACLYGGLNAIGAFLPDDRAAAVKNSIHSYIMTNCVQDGHFVKYVGTTEIDASLLWLNIPFAVVGLKDEIFQNTVREISEKLTTGEGVHRYPSDSYYGGGEWILLSCWFGLYEILTGERERAEKILNWVEQSADENGFLPEQVFGHMLNPDKHEMWVRRWGKPASPLLWSHAMYIILSKKISAQ